MDNSTVTFVILAVVVLIILGIVLRGCCPRPIHHNGWRSCNAAGRTAGPRSGRNGRTTNENRRAARAGRRWTAGACGQRRASTMPTSAPVAAAIAVACHGFSRT